MNWFISFKWLSVHPTEFQRIPLFMCTAHTTCILLSQYSTVQWNDCYWKCCSFQKFHPCSFQCTAPCPILAFLLCSFFKFLYPLLLFNFFTSSWMCFSYFMLLFGIFLSPMLRFRFVCAHCSKIIIWICSLLLCAKWSLLPAPGSPLTGLIIWI